MIGSQKKRNYKQVEKNIAIKIGHTVLSIFKAIKKLACSVFHFLDSKMTIMIVPHSQSKVINFQTNMFAMIFGITIVIGIASSFFYFNKQSISSNHQISKLQRENKETLASLDELRDENSNLLQTAKRFQSSLSKSFALLGIKQSENIKKSSMSDSDLSSLFDTKDVALGSVRETADIKQLTSYLNNAVEPVEQIGKMLENQNTLFSDIPNICPVKNRHVHISMAFGPNVNPFSGQWYIHKGLDFSTYRSGDQVIATANGQVVTVGFDSSFGNYIIIKHKYGFYTRYAHLLRTLVHKGQNVSQGEVIGNIGNTGMTTGPHLHYEVHIGSDVVDPAKYVNINFPE